MGSPYIIILNLKTDRQLPNFLAIQYMLLHVIRVAGTVLGYQITIHNILIHTVKFNDGAVGIHIPMTIIRMWGDTKQEVFCLTSVQQYLASAYVARGKLYHLFSKPWLYQPMMSYWHTMTWKGLL